MQPILHEHDCAILKGDLFKKSGFYAQLSAIRTKQTETEPPVTFGGSRAQWSSIILLEGQQQEK